MGLAAVTRREIWRGAAQVISGLVQVQKLQCDWAMIHPRNGGICAVY